MQTTDLYEPAQEAERHVWSALSSRVALENTIRWVCNHDDCLTVPCQYKLGALLHGPSLRNMLRIIHFEDANYVRKLGI